MKKYFLLTVIALMTGNIQLYAWKADNTILRSTSESSDSATTDNTQPPNTPVKAEPVVPTVMYYGILQPNDTLNTGGQDNIKYIKIPAETLPEAIKKTLTTEYSAYTVKTVYESDKKVKTYRIIMTDKEESEVVIIFDSDGKVL